MTGPVHCPECGAPVAQEMVDVGVGMIPMGDPYCTKCEWFEGGPDDFGFVAMDDREFAPPEAYI